MQEKPICKTADNNAQNNDVRIAECPFVFGHNDIHTIPACDEG